MSENIPKRMDDVEHSVSQIEYKLEGIEKDTGEIKNSLSSFDSKMTENMSQVADCLKTLISLVEKDKHKEKRIEQLEESDKLKNEKLAELDKQQALSNQAALSMQNTAKEIKDFLSSAGWKFIGGVFGFMAIMFTVFFNFIK